MQFLHVFPFVFIFMPFEPLKLVQESSEKQQINCVWPDILMIRAVPICNFYSIPNIFILNLISDTDTDIQYVIH